MTTKRKSRTRKRKQTKKNEDDQMDEAEDSLDEEADDVDKDDQTDEAEDSLDSSYGNPCEWTACGEACESQFGDDKPRVVKTSFLGCRRNNGGNGGQAVGRKLSENTDDASAGPDMIKMRCCPPLPEGVDAAVAAAEDEANCPWWDRRCNKSNDDDDDEENDDVEEESEEKTEEAPLPISDDDLEEIMGSIRDETLAFLGDAVSKAVEGDDDDDGAVRDGKFWDVLQAIVRPDKLKEMKKDKTKDSNGKTKLDDVKMLFEESPTIVVDSAAFAEGIDDVEDVARPVVKGLWKQSKEADVVAVLDVLERNATTMKDVVADLTRGPLKEGKGWLDAPEKTKDAVLEAVFKPEVLGRPVSWTKDDADSAGPLLAVVDVADLEMIKDDVLAKSDSVVHIRGEQLGELDEKLAWMEEKTFKDLVGKVNDTELDAAAEMLGKKEGWLRDTAKAVLDKAKSKEGRPTKPAVLGEATKVDMEKLGSLAVGLSPKELMDMPPAACEKLASMAVRTMDKDQLKAFSAEQITEMDDDAKAEFVGEKLSNLKDDDARKAATCRKITDAKGESILKCPVAVVDAEVVHETELELVDTETAVKTELISRGLPLAVVEKGLRRLTTRKCIQQERCAAAHVDKVEHGSEETQTRGLLQSDDDDVSVTILRFEAESDEEATTAASSVAAAAANDDSMVSDGLILTKQAGDDDDDDVPLIAGATVGAVLLLAGVAVVMLRRNKSTSDYNNERLSFAQEEMRSGSFEKTIDTTNPMYSNV